MPRKIKPPHAGVQGGRAAFPFRRPPSTLRGRIAVDHTTFYIWAQRYTPEIERRLPWHWRRPRSTSWRADEADVKMRGRWAYLYRAIDKHGDTVDFHLSPTRNAKAAKRLLAKALRALRAAERPKLINTDRAPTYGAAIATLK